MLGTGITVVEATKVEVLRLTEFSEEMVFTEVVRMVEVVNFWKEVVLADLIGLAEVARVVVLQGTVEGLIEVVFADLSEVVEVLLVLLGDTRVLLEILLVLFGDTSVALVDLLVLSAGLIELLVVLRGTS